MKKQSSKSGTAMPGAALRSSVRTTGHVIFRMTDGKPEFLGINPSADSAKKDIETLGRVSGQAWQSAPVPFVGWGQVMPEGIFMTNSGKPVLSIVQGGRRDD